MSIIDRSSTHFAAARAGLVAAVAVGLWAGVAQAQEVYLNGVKVGQGLKETEFKGAEVRFDAQGDVHITVPGYSVEVVEPGAPAAKAEQAVAQEKYWMVVEMPLTGHYRLRATLNGQLVAEVSGGQSQAVEDVSKYVIKGENRFEVVFLPLPDAPKITGAEAVKLMLGRGEETATDTLAIEDVLGEVSLKSGERSALSKSITFTGR